MASKNRMTQFILKKINDEAITPLHKILTDCGALMCANLGLSHWHPFMSVESFKNSLHNKDLYGIYEYETAVATFNLSVKSRDYYYDQLWSNPEEQASYLGQLGIAPSHQGKGIGKWCMQQIENIARFNGSKAIRFDALSSHPWLTTFYQQLGYQPCGIVKPKQWNLICFEKILR